MSVVSQATELYDVLDKWAVANEDLGQLNEVPLKALRDGGFFSLLAPNSRGGAEPSPRDAIESVEELSRADGSSAWVVLACNVATAAAAAYLDPAVSEKIFAGQHPIIAGQGAPFGRATIDGNGFRITGRWNYGSGILHATHVHACAIVMEGDAPRKLPTGEPEMRMFVIPPEKVQLYRDWDVIGLRATASIDYSIENVFIPSEFSYLARSNTSSVGGSLYRVGITGFALIGHTGFALGMARRALDEIAAIAQTSRSFATSDKFLQDFASAQSAYRAAKAFAMSEWEKAEQSIQHEALSTRQVTLLRMALIHATNAAVEICTFAYRAAGGKALRRCAIERCLRDVLAGAQHLHVSPSILTACGKEIGDLAPESKWAGFALLEKRNG